MKVDVIFLDKAREFDLEWVAEDINGSETTICILRYEEKVFAGISTCPNDPIGEATNRAVMRFLRSFLPDTWKEAVWEEIKEKIK